jgi:ATP-binding cassette subfamily G (WHITE) protein 2 (SNQ2)
MDEKPAISETSNGSDVDSLHIVGAYEQHRERLRDANPQGVTSHQSGVDVKKAEEEFSELNRQFSTISHQTHRLSKQISRASRPAEKTEDVERSDSTDSDEPWDLETTLRGNRAAESAAGIRNKRIGNLRAPIDLGVLSY